MNAVGCVNAVVRVTHWTKQEMNNAEPPIYEPELIIDRSKRDKRDRLSTSMEQNAVM